MRRRRGRRGEGRGWGGQRPRPSTGTAWHRLRGDGKGGRGGKEKARVLTRAFFLNRIRAENQRLTPILTIDWFSDPAAAALTVTVPAPVFRLVSCLPTLPGAFDRMVAEPPLGMPVLEMVALVLTAPVSCLARQLTFALRMMHSVWAVGQVTRASL